MPGRIRRMAINFLKKFEARRANKLYTARQDAGLLRTDAKNHVATSHSPSGLKEGIELEREIMRTRAAALNRKAERLEQPGLASRLRKRLEQ
ncbi:MAG: hypothetical protein NUV57_06385 [archaeon]|nr:hypothetical protein [archaeon]